jgi:hypothetical protein
VEEKKVWDVWAEKERRARMILLMTVDEWVKRGLEMDKLDDTRDLLGKLNDFGKAPECCIA